MKVSLSLMVTMILGDAFYAKVKGVAPKIFLGASPLEPLPTFPPTLFSLATSLGLRSTWPLISYGVHSVFLSFPILKRIHGDEVSGLSLLSAFIPKISLGIKNNSHELYEYEFMNSITIPESIFCSIQNFINHGALRTHLC